MMAGRRPKRLKAQPEERHLTPVIEGVPDEVAEHEWTTVDGKTRRFTEQQAKLIAAVAVDGLSVERAAEEAGYADKKTALAVLRLPEVEKVVGRLVQQRLTLLAPLAVKQLEHLIENARSEKVMHDAINTALTMAGHGQQQRAGTGQSITINFDMGE